MPPTEDPFACTTCRVPANLATGMDAQKLRCQDKAALGDPVVLADALLCNWSLCSYSSVLFLLSAGSRA